MSGLAQQQAALLRALWQPRHADAMETIAECVRPTGTGAQKHWERGLQAYRSNGLLLAQRVLAAAYPVAAQLLGEENFEALARRLWRQRPPERGDLAQWGGAFAGLLAATPGLAQEDPYLPDVARTEWALHTVATAPDATPDAASLGLLVECDPAELTLVLSPETQCVASAWPVVSIVQAHRSAEPSLQEAGRLLREQVSQTAVVWRQGLTPRLRVAQAGEAAFIAVLQQGRSLLQALDAAPELDFNTWLPAAVQDGLLVACARSDPH
ncbi:MAG: hypothetical protein EOO25_14250 [Comamonadaceae bacterium]|nr:MAG: hypothetical protein EOO25_14250 [Comamonadaceae bacterium]